MKRHSIENEIKVKVIDWKYCGYCGAKLELKHISEEDEYTTKFDRNTGQQMYRVTLRCPNAKGINSSLHDAPYWWQNKCGDISTR